MKRLLFVCIIISGLGLIIVGCKKGELVIDVEEENGGRIKYDDEYVLAIACSELLGENIADKNWSTGKEWYEVYLESETENQHKGYYYYYNIVGRHDLKVISDDGIELTKTMTGLENITSWILISYWGKGESAKIDINSMDSPFLWK